jgi:hypothetical protein
VKNELLEMIGDEPWEDRSYRTQNTYVGTTYQGRIKSKDGLRIIETGHPEITRFLLQALRVARQTNRTPDELLAERDRWEDEATRLNAENERLRDLGQELAAELHRYYLGSMGFDVSGDPKTRRILEKSKEVLRAGS